MVRFFSAPDAWVNWLVRYAAGRTIFDVGCGDCHLVSAVWAAGGKALGIDPRYDRECPLYVGDPPAALRSCILPMYAEDCIVLHKWQQALVLFCRPCHDGFPGRTLPLLQPSSEALYVGYEENLVRDVSRSGAEVARLGDGTMPALADGQEVFRLTRGTR